MQNCSHLQVAENRLLIVPLNPISTSLHCVDDDDDPELREGPVIFGRATTGTSFVQQPRPKPRPKARECDLEEVVPHRDCEERVTREECVATLNSVWVPIEAGIGQFWVPCRQ